MTSKRSSAKARTARTPVAYRVSARTVLSSGQAAVDKKPRFKLSPELADGEHWTVVNTPHEVVQAVQLWAENTVGPASEGDNFSVEVVMMTDAEVDALPEI